MADEKKAGPAKKKAAPAKTRRSPAKKKAAPAKTKRSPATKKAAPAKTRRSPAKKKAAPRRVPGTALVIVESPAKARTIKKYLGPGYTVKASVGHVKDLPKSKLGVDLENNFEPEYVVIGDKKKVITEIRKAAREAEVVYLAPDPDREGEAIAWHIAEEIRSVNPNIKRVLFNEITRKGVTDALARPTVLDQSKADAQQARRILDRLVGYQISPILWKKVRRGLSAGRVQSVAVRLLVEREAVIAAFVPEEYWSVDCECSAAEPPPFVAKLREWDGAKAAPKTEAEAKVIAAELEAGPAHVHAIARKQRRRRPQPPFITSKLQQDASRKLGFTPKRTMALAQRLYEGIELGRQGPVGLITYMRTDSTRVSDDALAEVRSFIGEHYGRDFLPASPNLYRTTKRAQDAHEAIRPTSAERTPEVVHAALLKHKDGKDLAKLYRLIWNRFVASQMMPAIYDQTTADIRRGRVMLRATGQVMRFAGYTRVYTARETDDAKAEQADSADKLLPKLEVGDLVTLVKILPEQHFTQPPPRFTEASLVKELEDLGIGRPSTYAAILSTIVDRGYAEKESARFRPTELGTLVNGLLVASFPDILDVDFTAQMEASLDRVEDGDVAWRELLGRFHVPFTKALEHARAHMRDVKREETPTEHVCEMCQSPMVVKFGRNGSFLACEGYPDCRNTKEIVEHADGTVEIVAEPASDVVCDACEAPMVAKHGRFGPFLACSRYPACKHTMAISIGVDCPNDGCGGFVTEKRSRRGKVFFGCSNYAKTHCDFVTWDRPLSRACPTCQAKFLVKKETRRGTAIQCLSCEYKTNEPEEGAV